MRTILTAVGLVTLTSIVRTAAASTNVTKLQPAGEAADFTRWTGNNSEVSVKDRVMTVRFGVADYPNAHTSSTGPWDWHAHGIAIDVENPGKARVDFRLRLDDSPEADGSRHCAYALGTIGPGEHAVYSTGFGAPKSDTPSMRGYPPVMPGTRPMHVSIAEPFDPSHIVAMQIFEDHPKQPSTLIVRRIALTPPSSLDDIVDEFGQYTGMDWPGKVHSVDELKARAKSENADLRAHATLPDRDRFGGWTAGPKLKSTGFFRTQKVDGKWWLVTPDGNLFWSTGIDTMTFGDYTLMNGDRKSMFTWLPEPSDTLYKHTSEQTWNFGGKSISGRWIDFYGVNLERKYGADYEKAWREMSLRRMRAWGFNTVGNWSEPLQPNDQVPYVATIWVGGSHKRVSGGWDYWGEMHDPFDPQFAGDVADSVKGTAARIKDDPMCLGYFVDNELSWSGWDGKRGSIALAYGALSLDASTSPAKKALVDDMVAKYTSIGDLNRAWGAAFASWDDLRKPFVPKDDPNDAMAKDLDAYVHHFATQYFTVVRDALKAADPNHLYLGCRFAAFSPTIVDAAASVCDVVSFNVYAKTLDQARFGFLSKVDKPCIIGEFHFGALDRGMFSPGLVEAPDQEGRGRMYRAFVDSVLASPNFVGAHWFEYEDEPLTGRFDGENYQIGLVSVTDTPYPELIKAAQAEHRSMYAKRYGK